VLVGLVRPHRNGREVGREGGERKTLPIGESDRETLFAHSVFIHILKQNAGLHNKQYGKFSCIFRTDWQKVINRAKIALQISTELIYNRDKESLRGKARGETK